MTRGHLKRKIKKERAITKSLGTKKLTGSAEKMVHTLN